MNYELLAAETRRPMPWTRLECYLGVAGTKTGLEKFSFEYNVRKLREVQDKFSRLYQPKKNIGSKC